MLIAGWTLLSWLSLQVPTLVHSRVTKPSRLSVRRSGDQNPWSLFEGIQQSDDLHSCRPVTTIDWTDLGHNVPLPDDRPCGTYVLFILNVAGSPAEGKFTIPPALGFSNQSSSQISGILKSVTEVMLDTLKPWLSSGDYVITEPQRPQDIGFWQGLPFFGFENTTCPFSKCSTRHWCMPFYQSIFDMIARRTNADKKSWAYWSAFDFEDFLSRNYGRKRSTGNPFLSCPIFLKPTQTLLASSHIDYRCGTSGADPLVPGIPLGATTAEPNSLNVIGFRENLKVFKEGGLDSTLVRWPGIGDDSYSFRGKETLTVALGRQLMGLLDYTCDLRNPCRVPLRCDEIGSRTALGISGKVFRSNWGYYALITIQNLNQHFSNQFRSVDGAGIRSILNGLTIKDYWPDPIPKTDLRFTLANIGNFFAAATGVLPAVAQGITLVGGIAGSFGVAFATKIGDQIDRTQASDTFIPQLTAAYEVMVNTIYDLSNALFNDSVVEGGTLSDVLPNWIDQMKLQSLPSLEVELHRALMSHGLDALWKTKYRNKLWVLYLNQESAGITCVDDVSGPTETRYCDEKDPFGVYYTYNFIEKDDHQGFVGYPWGYDKFKALDLELNWVTEGSAKTFLLAKNNGDSSLPEAFDPFKVNSTLLYDALKGSKLGTSEVSYRGEAGRYAGSWTIPVCNASTWGSIWNWRFTSNEEFWDIEYTTLVDVTIRRARTHPPCMCGPGGRETARFVESAGLKGFDTFYERCAKSLRSRDFIWPPDVQYVDFGFRDKITNPNYSAGP